MTEEETLIADVKQMLVRIGFTLGECFAPNTGHNLHPKKRKKFDAPTHYYEVNASCGDVTTQITFRRNGCSFYAHTKSIGWTGSPYYTDGVKHLKHDLLQAVQSASRYAQITADSAQ